MKRGQWLKLLIGLIAVFALFQWSGGALGSDRGQAGIVIGVMVVAATVICERLLFGKSFRDSITAVGLKRPKMAGTVTALTISVMMFSTIFLFAKVTGASFSFYPGWYWLVPGLFFQAGIAEETLFRGYLFGHLRQKHTFWKAAAFGALPFILVHLILFYSLPWSLAGASILLAVAMSFPLSRLFELDGDSVWAPAMVHFVAQGTVKVLVAEGESAWLFPFFWIAACAVIPLFVYAAPGLLKRAGKTSAARRFSPAAALVCVLAFPADGQDKKPLEPAPLSETKIDFWSQEEMTGDWDGKRVELREKGIDLKFRLTQYYQGTATGGTGRRSGLSGKFDTHFKFDLEKLFGWKRLSVQIKTETRFGRTINTGGVLPVNAGIISPASSEGAIFSVTALNFTQLIPINQEKGDFIAVGAGKYYSLDSSREPFTGGAGVTRFMNIAANGNPAVGRTIPTVSNGATFAWIRKGTPFITFAVFDPVASPVKPGLKRLFREGLTFAPGISFPTKFAGKSGRHSLSGTVTTRKFTPFDQLAQFIQPGSPAVPISPKSGSWSLTYTFHQYLGERPVGNGQKNGWGVFGVFTVADQTTNPVGRFMTFGLGGNALFKGRSRDQFGVAYGLTGVSRKLKTVLEPLLKIRDEHHFETFYSFLMTGWLSLAADLQIIRPALEEARPAIVPGARLVIHF